MSVCLTVFFCVLLPLSLSFLLALVRLIYNLHTFSWSWSHFAFSSDLSISSRPPPPHLPPVTCVYVFPCYLLCLYCTYFCWSHSYLTFDCSLYFSPIFAVSCVYVFPCSLLCLYCTYFCCPHSYLTFDYTLYFSLTRVNLQLIPY